jgi:hypothetical protein
VENVEADQSYFMAEVNTITKKSFDKQLATIPPVLSLGPKYTVTEGEMCSMKLDPEVGFVWERELVDHDYIMVNHREVPLEEEDVLITRTSAYMKVTDDLIDGVCRLTNGVRYRKGIHD